MQPLFLGKIADNSSIDRFVIAGEKSVMTKHYSNLYRRGCLKKRHLLVPRLPLQVIVPEICAVKFFPNCKLATILCKSKRKREIVIEITSRVRKSKQEIKPNRKKNEANLSKDRVQSEIIHLKCLHVQNETYKQSMQRNEKK